MQKNKILQGDCLEKMAELEDNSIDTIITDPPYGLSFMGKKWDYDVPSIEVWQECLRVLKPGGTALIFAGSRTQHRMAVNVEDAGFILKDCIMWLYGSGFPKATDISKQLDKGHKRKVIGEQKLQGTARRMKGGNYGDFGGEDTADVVDITEPATEEAKLWNGWKSHGLKPAYEPILVAVKPNDGTYANNALEWGVSGLNIDGGRIGTEQIEQGREGRGVADSTSYHDGLKPTERTMATGRFPANILLDEHTANNAGEWSRYFYVAKASKSERGEENNHPTVKPIKLMEYLCTLTKTPTGGCVLDPFAGSGTTGLACINTGRDYILIEREEEYIPIIKARLNIKQTKLI